METLEWFARAWGALDGFHRLAMVAGIALFVWGVFPALGQKKEGGGVAMEKPSVIINGPAQIGDGNVQQNTIVNAAAAYLTKGEVAQGKEGDMHHTSLSKQGSGKVAKVEGSRTHSVGSSAALRFVA